MFNVWPKTTLLLPVWPRDAKSLDTPGKDVRFDLYRPAFYNQLHSLFVIFYLVFLIEYSSFIFICTTKFGMLMLVRDGQGQEIEGGENRWLVR